MTRLRLQDSLDGRPAMKLGASRLASPAATDDRVVDDASASSVLDAPVDPLATLRVALEAEYQTKHEQLEASIEAEETRLAEDAKRYRARLAEEVNLLADEVAALQARLEREAVEWAAEVGFTALVRLLGQTRADAALIRSVCDAIADEQGLPTLTLRLHPDLLDEVPARTGLTIIPDAEIGKAQVIVETSRGDIDSGVAVRLRSLCDGLIAGLQS